MDSSCCQHACKRLRYNVSILARWACVLAALAIPPLTSCAHAPDDSPNATGQPISIPTADYSGRGPGSLIEAETIPDIDTAIPMGTTSARVLYRSTSGLDGSATEVSGAVFIPRGRPPSGGWPVIAYAHGTTGLNVECGPSLYPDLVGATTAIAKFLRLGFAVAATDYQGLGAPGVHPYYDAKTAGLNVIDSVRALRAVSRDVSANWSAFGGSQGGAATWAANEQASTYAVDLNLVGTVSVSPAIGASGYVAAAAKQTLTKDQQAAYIGILIALERTRPDFPIEDYRRGLVEEQWTTLSACTGTAAKERERLLADLSPADLVPATPEAEQRLFEILEGVSLAQQPAAAPMLVIYGGQDSFIEPSWVDEAIAEACTLGDTIESIFQPDGGHGDLDYAAYQEWLKERYAGLPAPNSCQPVR